MGNANKGPSQLSKSCLCHCIQSWSSARSHCIFEKSRLFFHPFQSPGWSPTSYCMEFWCSWLMEPFWWIKTGNKSLAGLTQSMCRKTMNWLPWGCGTPPCWEWLTAAFVCIAHLINCVSTGKSAWFFSMHCVWRKRCMKNCVLGSPTVQKASQNVYLANFYLLYCLHWPAFVICWQFIKMDFMFSFSVCPLISLKPPQLSVCANESLHLCLCALNPSFLQSIPASVVFYFLVALQTYHLTAWFWLCKSVHIRDMWDHGVLPCLLIFKLRYLIPWTLLFHSTRDSMIVYTPPTPVLNSFAMFTYWPLGWRNNQCPYWP